MARYAIIESGVVSNVIEAEAEFAESIGAIPAQNAGIGYLWDGSDFTSPPEPKPPIPVAVTSLQFMDRFTEEEQLAIVSATLASPQVKLWYDRMIAATEIVFKDPRTLGGLQALVGAGLITQARMDEILPEAWR